MPNLPERNRMFTPLVAFASLLLLAGCPGPVERQTETAEKNRLPKLSFHKPADFPAAVTRLKEIHEAVLSDQPLPSPKTFRVVESIHGVGPGAHSHYHLARESGDEGHSHDDAHGHSHDGESSEITHDVQVDVVTEMVDIVKWMPDIAADSDMEKGGWDQVKQASGDLHDRLTETLAQADGPQAQREKLRELNGQLTEYLETMSSVTSQTEAPTTESSQTPGE